MILALAEKTVSRAYNLLEAAEVIRSHQGRGTYVSVDSSSLPMQVKSDSSEILDHVDVLTGKAIKDNLSQNQLIKLVNDRIKWNYSKHTEKKAIFVECNIEQAQSFARQLEETSDVKIEACTLKELKAMSAEVLELMDLSQNIITTFNHIGQVNEILDEKSIKKSVLGIAITPNFESLIRIAKQPPGTKFGLISLSEEFFFNVKSALKSARIESVQMDFTISQDEETIKSFMQDLDVVIVSPGRFEDIQVLAGHDKEIISFEYLLDPGSAQVVTSKLRRGSDAFHK